jgi:hypothetical protein
MKQPTQLTLVHVGCVIAIAACFGIALIVMGHAPFPAQAQIAQTLVGAGFFLWGKLGFTPSRAVLEKILAAMPPEEVARITQKPPPLPPQGPPPIAAPPPAV